VSRFEDEGRRRAARIFGRVAVRWHDRVLAQDVGVGTALRLLTWMAVSGQEWEPWAPGPQGRVAGQLRRAEERRGAPVGADPANGS
jgi:hypothetical protein